VFGVSLSGFAVLKSHAVQRCSEKNPTIAE
jgi:hypothetical protein